MAARHVSADTTYTNTDLPGHDFMCFGVEEAHVGFQYEKVKRERERVGSLEVCKVGGRTMLLLLLLHAWRHELCNIT